MKAADGRTIGSVTFEAIGSRVPLTNVINGRQHWSFGPFDFKADLYITITYMKKDQWAANKMVGPLSVSFWGSCLFKTSSLLSVPLSPDFQKA